MPLGRPGVPTGTTVVVLVSLIALALAIVARPFGYGLGSIAWFWCFAVCLLLTATLGVVRVFPWRGVADATIRTAVVAMALVVSCGLLLGAIGWIGRAPYLIVMAVGLAGAAAIARRADRPVTGVFSGVPWPAVGFCGAIAIAVVSFGLSHSPLTAYDSLSYHLFFPARWLQEHRLFIIPTPFSDEAQSYAPANGELWFLWLMLPFHGDLLARIGQVPFYLLIGTACYALARRMGARPPHAIYPAMFAFVSRPILEQAVGADVDLICWSLFLSAIYLAIVAFDSNHRRDWLLTGVAAGLYAGTKYVALVYAPLLALLLLIGLWRQRRRRIAGVAASGGSSRSWLWLWPGIAALGLPWYLRNWIAAGSPLYPASLSIAGVTIARGAYSRAAMMYSVFHTTDVRLFPVMAAHAFGVTLILCWAPFALLGAVGVLRTAPRWPAVLVLAAPLLMVPLYWFGVPDNVDSRFLLPAAILALIPLAFAFRTGQSTWNGVIHVLYAAALLWICVGLDAELHANLPWYMGGWLALRGVVTAQYLPWLGAVAVVIALAWRALGATRYGVVACTAAMAAIAAVAGAGAGQWCAPEKCDYLQTTSIFLRSSFLEAWRWTDAQPGGARIAYTGNNVPYPLMGAHLGHVVQYVNIDRHAGWRFHDYDSAFRHRLATIDPAPLAASSGVLLPLRPSGGQVDAVRPRYERMRGDRAAWMSNLREAGVTRLFISALSAYEIDFVWHNGGGFPIEDDWARSAPDTFKIVYENAQVRIYRVDFPGIGR